MSIYQGNNVFERIGSMIPGYQGYSDRKKRKDSDKILRDQLARMSRRASGNISVAMRNLVDSGDIGKIASYEMVRKRAELVANRLQYANYGSSGFFDVVQFDISTIDKIYSLDFHLTELITDTCTLVERLPNEHNDEALINAANSKLELIAKELDRRNDLIMGGY